MIKLMLSRERAKILFETLSNVLASEPDLGVVADQDGEVRGELIEEMRDVRDELQALLERSRRYTFSVGGELSFQVEATSRKEALEAVEEILNAAECTGMFVPECSVSAFKVRFTNPDGYSPQLVPDDEKDDEKEV